MNKYPITRDDEIIVVVGPAGSGKSTFINHAIKGDGKSIGHGMNPFTTAITVHKRRLGNPPRSIAFVDTPGIDKTGHIDIMVIAEIAEFLNQYHQNGFRIGRVLYLQRLTDNRAAPAPDDALKSLSNMCSGITMLNAIIVTTMQSLVKDNATRKRRVNELRTMAESLSALGARLMQFGDTTESAWAIALGQSSSSSEGSQSRSPEVKGKDVTDDPPSTKIQEPEPTSPPNIENRSGTDPNVGNSSTSGPLQGRPVNSKPPKAQGTASNLAKAQDKAFSVVLHPSTIPMIENIRRDLNGLQQMMKKEIARSRDLQVTIVQLEASLEEQNKIMAFYEEQVKRLKKEKDQLSEPNVSVPHPSVLEIFKEEHEHNKRKFDEHIKRWEGPSNKVKEMITSLNEKLESTRLELKAVREALVVHDGLKKHMANALDEIETRVKQSRSEDELEAMIASIEASISVSGSGASKSVGDK